MGTYLVTDRTCMHTDHACRYKSYKQVYRWFLHVNAQPEIVSVTEQNILACKYIAPMATEIISASVQNIHACKYIPPTGISEYSTFLHLNTLHQWVQRSNQQGYRTFMHVNTMHQLEQRLYQQVYRTFLHVNTLHQWVQSSYQRVWFGDYPVVWGLPSGLGIRIQPTFALLSVIRVN